MSPKTKLIEIVKQCPEINSITLEGHDFDTVNIEGRMVVWLDEDKENTNKTLVRLSDLYTPDEDAYDYDSIYTRVVSLLGKPRGNFDYELKRGVDF